MGIEQIHIKDLPKRCVLDFNKEGNSILADILTKAKQIGGLDSIERKYGINFYCLKNCIEGKQAGLTVKQMLKFIAFLEKNNIRINVQLLERSIRSIRMIGKGREMNVDGLPIKLSNKKWAIIFGSIPDAWPKRFIIEIENRNFENDMTKKLNELGISPLHKRNGKMARIEGHSILGHIISLGGININEKQILANNPLPLWIFNECNEEFHAMLLSKIVDTEGHVNKRKPQIRIAQSSLLSINQKERGYILDNAKETIIRPSGKKSCVLLYSKLNQELKEKVLDNPPLILLSVQLLLRKYKINSCLYSTNVYISSNNLCSIGWQLCINGYADVKKFYEHVGEYISIKYKREGILNSIKGRSKIHAGKRLKKAYYLLQALEIEKEKGMFSIKELTEICKKKPKTIYNAFGELIHDGCITKNGVKGRCDMLVISNKGKDYLKNYPDYEKWGKLGV